MENFSSYVFSYESCAWPGLAWPGWAWLGLALPLLAFAWPGLGWLGLAWLEKPCGLLSFRSNIWKNMCFIVSWRKHVEKAAVLLCARSTILKNHEFY